jgi:hypothetical protein
VTDAIALLEDSYEGRQAVLTMSNLPASAFVTSVKPCLPPSKIVGLLLLSRSICPDGKKWVSVIFRAMGWNS